ncbi:MAG: Hpt domain-containing protein [Proteobacteria bacterium]|nr:Hpt domain-containing protein [Pseudomonadota bacterium]
MKNESNEDVPPLIDKSVLDELRSIMEDEYTEVLQIYPEESINLMTEIHSGFAEDSENLLRFVHTLKSSSKNVGVMRLGFIAEKMEVLIRDNNVESARTCPDELQDVFAQSHVLIKTHVQGDIQAAAL